MSNTIELKREEFRKYLVECGVMSAISNALIKLYDEPNKPKDAIEFVKNQMCSDTAAAMKASKSNSDNRDNISENNSSENIEFHHENDNYDNNTYNNDEIIMENNEIDIETQALLEREYENLQLNYDCKTLLKKYLTKDLFEKLQCKKTKYNSTLYDCIKAVKDDDNNSIEKVIGIHASDPDVFIIFKDIFDLIINDYHKIDKDFTQPAINWGDRMILNDLESIWATSNNNLILSKGICCERSIDGYAFLVKLSTVELNNIRNKIQNITENCNIIGNFYCLPEMKAELFDLFQNNNLILNEINKMEQSYSGVNDGIGGGNVGDCGTQGIFINEDTTFLLVINQWNHVKFLSITNNGEDTFGKLYQQLIEFHDKLIEMGLTFVHHDRYGWLTASAPATLGTALKIFINIKLNKSQENNEQFKEIIDKFNLNIQLLQSNEENDDSYEISNKIQIGKTEYEIMTEFYNGINEIIKIQQ